MLIKEEGWDWMKWDGSDEEDVLKRNGLDEEDGLKK
jgi:hypothetical protein